MNKFRYIFVVEPGRDFSALAGMCDRVRFMASGYELFEELVPVIEKSLQDFDPEQDAVVAVGRVNSCFIAGSVLQKLMQGKLWYMGFYNYPDRSYEFAKIGADGGQ